MNIQSEKYHKKLIVIVISIIVLNPFFYISQTEILRATDVLSLFFFIIFISKTVIGKIRLRADMILILFSLTILIALMDALVSNDWTRSVVATRVLLSIATGYVLVSWITCYDALSELRLGAVTGAILGIVISYGQKYGIQDFLVLMPPDSLTTYIFQTLRVSGVWGHSNENSIVLFFGLSFALISTLSNNRQLSIPMRHVFFFCIISMLVYLIGYSRSIIIVCALSLLYISVYDKKIVFKWVSIFSVLTFLCFIAFDANIIFGERWDVNSLNLNTWEQTKLRIGSTLTGMLHGLWFPFGINTIDKVYFLLSKNIGSATHNALISFLLAFGVFSFLLLLILLLRYIRIVTSLHMPTIIIMLLVPFEDFAFNPTIIVLVSLVFWYNFFEVKGIKRNGYANSSLKISAS